MKIVKIARHCCIRVQKMALPLLERGHEVHVITHKYPSFGEKYRSVMLYENLDQLYESIKLHKDADVFHAHNEPSWFVTAVKNVIDKPVVLDVHDSMLVRVRKSDTKHVRISVDERNNFQLADGLVFPSSPMEKLCKGEFGITVPSITLPPYVPKTFYRLDSWKWMGGITYEGRVDLPKELSKEMEFFSYCDYTELAGKLKEAGIPFHLYTPRKDDAIKKHYEGAALWRGAYPYDTLMRQLGRHDWGLCGNIGKHMAWEYAMPNKLFEYIAAGIPVIALNAPLAGKFLEKEKIGISVKSVDEIKARWSEHRECRRNIALKRFNWCMENHIGNLEELYKRVI